jgi:hypothetical protein
MRALFLVIGIFLSSAALAIPVEWTLQNVIFTDGGTAFGSFVYDADTNIYSEVDITTTSGAVLSGTVYKFTNPYISGNASITQFLNAEGDLTGARFFGLIPLYDLTNELLSTSINNLDTGEYACSSSSCGGGSGLRGVNSGYITATSVVPVPAAVWLFGSALAGLGWFRRKTA